MQVTRIDNAMQRVAPEQFKIEYTKIAKDIEGNDVEVFDEQRVEVVSLEDLQTRRQELQDQIKEIDIKITAITSIR